VEASNVGELCCGTSLLHHNHSAMEPAHAGAPPWLKVPTFEAHCTDAGGERSRRGARDGRRRPVALVHPARSGPAATLGERRREHGEEGTPLVRQTAGSGGVGLG
jgi:hypothetical protein